MENNNKNQIDDTVKSSSEAIVRRLDMIAQDMENDAKEFDGKPFDGKTVGTYFGYHGAAIVALAEIIKETLISKSA